MTSVEELDAALHDKLSTSGLTTAEMQDAILRRAPTRFEDRPDIGLWEFLNEVDDPTGHDWAIPGLVERGDRVMITGGEGGGKSTLLRQMSLQAVAGIHPFTLEPMDPLTVLYVDCENSAAQARRGFHWMLDPIPVEQRPGLRLFPHALGHSLELVDLSVVASLCERVERLEVDVVTIGPLWKLSDGNPKDDQAMKAVADALDQVRMVRGSVLLMEAHAPHAGEHGRPGRPSGWSGWMRWPEFGFWLDKSGRLRSWRGQREARDWPERLVRGGVWPWLPGAPAPSKEAEPTERTDSMLDAVVAVLTEHGELPMRHVEERVPGRRGDVRDTMEMGLGLGVLTERRGAKNARMISLAVLPGRAGESTGEQG